MIPLLLLCLASLTAANSDPVDNSQGKWTVFDKITGTCIKMNAQIDLTLSYYKDDDSLADAVMVKVPFDAISDAHSSCYETVLIGGQSIPSQILQLDFPQNEGWNVRLAFTQDPRLGVDPGDYALYQVNITVNSTSTDLFKDAPKDHIHTYYTEIDLDSDPPEIANDEYTRTGYSIYCPSAAGYIINQDAHNGPSAFIRLSNLQMQAYMNADDFGKKWTCAADQTDVDLVPVIVSGVLAALVLFTLIAYFVYRSRLPTDILDTIEPEFEEEDEHHHKEHNNLNHHDNYGYNEEDHRF